MSHNLAAKSWLANAISNGMTPYKGKLSLKTTLASHHSLPLLFLTLGFVLANGTAKIWHAGC